MRTAKEIKQELKTKQELISTKKAFLFGINDYVDESNNLRFCYADAKEVGEYVNKHYGYETLSTYNKNATKKNILEILTKRAKETTPDCVSLVFFSGHGWNNGKQEGIVAHDQLIADTEILNILNQYKGLVYWIADSCHAGDNYKLYPHLGVKQINVEQATKEVTTKKVVKCNLVAITACQKNELSQESGLLKHGAFSKGFLETLPMNKDIVSAYQIIRKRTNYYNSSQNPRLDIFNCDTMTIYKRILCL